LFDRLFAFLGGVTIAITRLISMCQNKGKSIAECLADRTDYAKNPDKTNKSEYISSYECAPKTVEGEFLLAKRIYNDITGREQPNDVIAMGILPNKQICPKSRKGILNKIARCVPPNPACHFSFTINMDLQKNVNYKVFHLILPTNL
jgi:hypothetical protein